VKDPVHLLYFVLRAECLLWKAGVGSHVHPEQAHIHPSIAASLIDSGIGKADTRLRFVQVWAGAPDADHVTIEIECGKGTYVRAIVRDLAELLGACGHVSELRRTRVGRFTEADSVTLELLEDLGYEARQSEALLPVETALDDIPVLAVTDEDAFRLKQGRSIVLVPRQVELVKARLKPGSRTVSAMAGERVVALCEMRAGRLEPSRVFNL